MHWLLIQPIVQLNLAHKKEIINSFSHSPSIRNQTTDVKGSDVHVHVIVVLHARLGGCSRVPLCTQVEWVLVVIALACTALHCTIT